MELNEGRLARGAGPQIMQLSHHRVGQDDLPDPLPRGIVINEAIELAKRFSTADSGKFINGILDKIGRAGDDVPEKKES